jgi:predicted HTH transcriptional regulator
MEQMQSFTAPMYNRNPKLQFAFGGTNLVEGRGLGMRTFGTAAAKHHLPVPKYAFDGLYLNLTIYRHAQAAVGALKTDVAKALNEDEKRGWEYLATKTSVTRKEFAEQMGFDSRKAQRHLRRLVELGLLNKVGASSATEYEVRKP